MTQLTDDERQQFESQKYSMMEVMLLDSGRIVLCYPGRKIALVLPHSYSSLQLQAELKKWNSRPDDYQPPEPAQLTLELDDEMELRI